MNSGDAEAIARIHHGALPETFLSSLGIGFLTEMYSALANDHLSVIFVAEKEQKMIGKQRNKDDKKNEGKNETEKKIVGFVSGILESDTFIWRTILRSPYRLLKKIISQILKRPMIISKLIKTLRYGSICLVEGIDTELLAIAVVQGVQRSGLGSSLFAALLEDLKTKRIKKLKVLVGQELISAQNFYKKNNFILQKTIELYGKKKDILVKELN